VNSVKKSMADDVGKNEILYYFQTIVHDSALLRQLLYSAQVYRVSLSLESPFREVFPIAAQFVDDELIDKTT